MTKAESERIRAAVTGVTQADLERECRRKVFGALGVPISAVADLEHVNRAALMAQARRKIMEEEDQRTWEAVEEAIRDLPKLKKRGPKPMRFTQMRLW